jgi:hypothetical protein
VSPEEQTNRLTARIDDKRNIYRKRYATDADEDYI